MSQQEALAGCRGMFYASLLGVVFWSVLIGTLLHMAGVL